MFGIVVFEYGLARTHHFDLGQYKKGLDAEEPVKSPYFEETKAPVTWRLCLIRSRFDVGGCTVFR